MSKCKHEWQGNADGVTCIKCGTSLTHKGYLKLLNPADEQKDGSKSDADEAAEDEDPEEVDNDE